MKVKLHLWKTAHDQGSVV